MSSDETERQVCLGDKQAMASTCLEEEVDRGSHGL